MRSRGFVRWLESHGCTVSSREAPLGSDVMVVRRGARKVTIPKVAPDQQIDSDLVQEAVLRLGLDLRDLPDLSHTAE